MAQLNLTGDLHEDAKTGNLIRVKRWLDRGTPVNARKEGYTALHRACQTGQLEIVRFLLERGADIHARTFGYYGPLHWAAAGGHRAVVELLLQSGADLTAPLQNGKLAFELALEEGHQELGQWLQILSSEALKEGKTVHSSDHEQLRQQASGSTSSSTSTSSSASSSLASLPTVSGPLASVSTSVPGSSSPPLSSPPLGLGCQSEPVHAPIVLSPASPRLPLSLPLTTSVDTAVSPDQTLSPRGGGWKPISPRSPRAETPTPLSPRSRLALHSYSSENLAPILNKPQAQSTRDLPRTETTIELGHSRQPSNSSDQASTSSSPSSPSINNHNDGPRTSPTMTMGTTTMPSTNREGADGRAVSPSKRGAAAASFSWFLWKKKTK